MRLTISQSWLLVLTTTLCLSSSTRAAYSAAIDPPNIRTSCTSPTSQALLPPFPSPLRMPLIDLLTSDQSTQHKKVQALIRARRWEQAVQEWQQASTSVQNLTLRSLLVAMVESNETTRATQFIVNQFPPQSQQRAEGIGAIALGLINRNQFKDAIAVLKSLPQDSKYPDYAVVPVVGALTSTNQTKKIVEVMALFPKPQQQWSLWIELSNQVPVEPAQAAILANLIQHPSRFQLRSYVLSNMARYWLTDTRRDLPKAWKIANQIEECTLRTEAFLDIVKALKQSHLKLSKMQIWQALDQLEALLQTLPDPKQTYPFNPGRFYFSLASLNAQYGRKAQANRFLAQVTQDLKQVNSATVRSVTLIQLAAQYRSISNTSMALQMLDTAVPETHAGYQEQLSPSYRGIRFLGSPADWRNANLNEIAKLYRSLNQPQKAAALEQAFPKRPQFTTPGTLKHSL